MKVDKLLGNQPENWYEIVTRECSGYPIPLANIEYGELIVDIGCNVGGFVNAWKHISNNWLLVEPSKFNCEEITKNVVWFNYNLVNKAVHSYSNEILHLQSYVVDGNKTETGSFGTTGFLSKNNGHGWQGEYEEVETISFEDLIGDKEVGLLKIDCEGAEYEFLYGKDLRNVKYITGEFHNFLFYASDKGRDLVQWILTTHDEIYSEGDGVDSHFVKLYKRKDI